MPSSQTRGMLAACFIVEKEETLRRNSKHEEFREQKSVERSEEAVPLSDDTWKYGDMLIKTPRTHLERVKFNEGALPQDFTVVYFH